MNEEIQTYAICEKAKESFKQEALASWKACQETGLYLQNAQVQAWLYNWESEPKKEDLLCHE